MREHESECFLSFFRKRTGVPFLALVKRRIAAASHQQTHCQRVTLTANTFANALRPKAR